MNLGAREEAPKRTALCRGRSGSTMQRSTNPLKSRPEPPIRARSVSSLRSSWLSAWIADAEARSKLPMQNRALRVLRKLTCVSPATYADDHDGECSYGWLILINIARFRPQDKSSSPIRPQILLTRSSSGPNSLEATADPSVAQRMAHPRNGAYPKLEAAHQG